MSALEGGPYINAALICERVLREADGILSAVRIVDRFVINASVAGPMPATPLPRPPIPFTILVMFRAGSVHGTHNVAIRVERPDGLLRDMLNSQVLFEGGERATNFVAELNVGFETDGLYWFVVVFNGQPVTKIPLRILTTFQQVGLPEPGNSPFS